MLDRSCLLVLTGWDKIELGNLTDVIYFNCSLLNLILLETGNNRLLLTDVKIKKVLF